MAFYSVIVAYMELHFPELPPMHGSSFWFCESGNLKGSCNPWVMHSVQAHLVGVGSHSFPPPAFPNPGLYGEGPVSSEGHLCHQDWRWWEGMWALVCLWGFLLHVQLFFHILHPANLSEFRPTTRCTSNGHSRLFHLLSHCTRSSPCNKSLVPCHSWGLRSRSHQTQKMFFTLGRTAP